MGSSAGISHDVEHGVYIFLDGVWRRVNWGGVLSNSEGRKLIVYYGNTRCRACREFNRVWNSVAEAVRGFDDVRLAAVVCGWFEEDCRSEEARRLFSTQMILASPTMIAYCVKGGRSLELKRVEGALRTSQLAEFILAVRARQC